MSYRFVDGRREQHCILDYLPLLLGVPPSRVHSQCIAYVEGYDGVRFSFCRFPDKNCKGDGKLTYYMQEVLDVTG